MAKKKASTGKKKPAQKSCWKGYSRVKGKKAGEPGSCRKKGTK